MAKRSPKRFESCGNLVSRRQRIGVELALRDVGGKCADLLYTLDIVE
jgi:hypothetical protein